MDGRSNIGRDAPRSAAGTALPAAPARWRLWAPWQLWACVLLTGLTPAPAVAAGRGGARSARSVAVRSLGTRAVGTRAVGTRAVGTGSIATGPIATGSIATGPIATGPIATGLIATGPIATRSIATGSIATGSIATGSAATGSITARSTVAGTTASAVKLSQLSPSAPQPVVSGPRLPDAGLGSVSTGPVASSSPASPLDAGTRADAAASHALTAPGTAALPTPPPTPAPPAPMPQFKEEPLPTAADAGQATAKGKRPKGGRGKAPKAALTDIVLEAQNHSQPIARRYAQLLATGRYEEARLMHEEEGGRRPDWSTVRAAVQAYNELHGAPKEVEQHLVTSTGAELLTFFFTARYLDGSELPLRVAIDHHGHVAGAAAGNEVVAATKKRYDRYDHYKQHAQLTLPFYGTWTVSNATPGSGNGHYLNANQRFAIDFFITEEVEPGKRKSHRDRGKQNTDYFAFGKDVLAPADGTVVMVVDGILDNTPGQVDIYYRLGNSVVISLGNNEFVHLCHLQNGSMQVRVGDKLTRGQVVAKCGNSGNSTAPHLHFQLTDGPLISHAASLPAYFQGVQKEGGRPTSVLPLSGDRLTHARPIASAAAPTRDKAQPAESAN